MINSNDFCIRHVRKSDLAELIPLLSNNDLRGEYLPSRISSPTEFEKKFEKDGMSNEDAERLLIVDHAGQILGNIFHFKSGPYFNAREIGYVMLSTKHRNAGIASQAVKLVTHYLFDSLLINRLEIRMDTRNIASEKVAIKCGFKKEGVSRGANFVRGKHVDMNVYALLRDEVER
ncbi:MAG TPA: GNAT family protein [Burkholderiaceae bacterium]|nr:GNAT family protein [Burkholderiaceae bacterium]